MGALISQLIRLTKVCSILVTSTIKINVLLLSYQNKDIAVINFVKHFLNYFTDTHLMDFYILYLMFYSISDKYL